MFIGSLDITSTVRDFVEWLNSYFETFDWNMFALYRFPFAKWLSGLCPFIICMACLQFFFKLKKGFLV